MRTRLPEELPAFGHHPDVVIRPDRRLGLLALVKLAGIGAMVGLVFFAAPMSIEERILWPLLWVPPMLAVMLTATLGVATGLLWWLFPGQVTYSVADGFLTARRGRWIRKQIPVERIADVAFDQHIRWTHLAFTHWFGYGSPIPELSVTLTRTSNRWDPTNAAVVVLPRILLSGERQTTALRELRQALGLPAEEEVAVSAPRG